jgi:PAS domain S-box-containing protein
MIPTVSEPTVATRRFIARLLASVLLINMFVAVLSVLFLLQSRQQYISRAETQTQNLVTALELTLSGMINTTNLTLLSIVDEAEKQLKSGALDWKTLSEHEERQHSRIPAVDNFHIIQANGDMVAFAGDKLKILANIADRDHFIKLKQDANAGLVFSKPIFGRVNKKWLLIANRRINHPDGSFAGIIQATIAIDSLVKLFSAFDLGRDGVITLRDADLDVIARYPATQNGRSTIGSKTVSQELRNLVRNGEESGSYVSPGSIDTISRIFSFRKLSHYPFYVNAGRSPRDYLADWYDEIWKTAALCLLFALGTLFSARLMFLKWKNAQLAEIARQRHNEQLESRIAERTSELNSANSQLQTELAERKRIEEALRLREQHLRTIIEAEPHCVKLLDRNGALLMMNPAGLAMLQAESFDEVKGACAYQLVAPEHRETFMQAIKDGFQGKPGTLTFKMNDLKGGSLWLESRVVPLKNETGEISSMLVITRDITETKLVEEETRNNERRMASLLRITQHPFTTEDEFLDNALHEALALTESSIGYIYTYSEQNKQFVVNSWSKSAMQECSILEKKTSYELDSTGLWGEAVRQRKPIMLNDYRAEHPRKKGYPEGHVILSKFLTVPVLIDDAIVAVIGVANKEKDYTETDVLQLSLLMDSVWKITTRKRADEELLNLEKQFLHTQKLESLGVLAGGIAHDFNNLLTSIIGNADLALMRINPESPAVDNLRKIELASARAADLAKQMLAYSGKGRFVVEHIDMNRLLEEMLHMVEVSISKKAALRLNLTRPLATIEADATQMHQVVMNLIINASEALGDENGTITITTSCMDCDQSYLGSIWPSENLPAGSYVVLDVADTGCGMEKETLAKIFDPFFTTKFTGRGLGMAAVFGIIKGHKGAIKVYSEPGKGSVFRVLLPTSASRAGTDIDKTHHDEWKGNGTVLLVDDEEMVRSIGSEMLQELGFAVLTANDGQEALDLFKSRNDIDLVILDLTMPRLDGEQAFTGLRKIKPDINVIMSSGYNEQDVTQKFVGRGLAGFVQKPYKLSVLRDALRKIA